MTNFYNYNKGDLRLYSRTEISPVDRESLFTMVSKPSKSAANGLSGRGGASFGELEEWGEIVLKAYRRGGLLRYLVQNRYLRFGKTRPQVEFEMLEEVRALNIPAPNPVAFIVENKFLYRGWLVTERLPSTTSLADVSESNFELARGYVPVLADHVNKLIENLICHVDLHPGNVLVSPDREDARELFIIDFDKSRHFRGKKRDLRDYYLCRWRRAIIKHGLPDELIETVSSELRRRYA